MSAFVSLFDRSGSRLDETEIRRLAAPLAYRGDEVSAITIGAMAVAVVHRGGARSDREVDKRVLARGRTRAVAVAGRFTELEDSTSCAAPDLGAPVGEARRAFEAQGTGDWGFAARLAGSFAIISADMESGCMRLTRDHLGDCQVYYYLDSRWLIAASEPAAILEHGEVTVELDEARIAGFLGFRFAQTGRSFFRGIRELEPAHHLVVTQREASSQQYWRLRQLPELRSWTPEHVCTEFVSRLKQAVACGFRGAEPKNVALSLSGGLDSTALAAVSPPEIGVYSWFFADTPECDERPEIEKVAARLNLRVNWVCGDGLYPLSESYRERFVDGSSPYLNAFAALKHRLYREALEAGYERVMVGDGGDALYSAERYWLQDTLKSKPLEFPLRFLKALRDALSGDPFARTALRCVIPLLGGRSVLGARGRPWLTDFGVSALPGQSPSAVVPKAAELRYELGVGVRHAEIESEERRLFDRCGVGRSNPFRYWPLLELVLGLPAYWYYQDGRRKVLTRKAMVDRLPHSIVQSPRTATLAAFFLRGIADHGRELREMVFRKPASDWQRYVDRQWLEPYLAGAGPVTFGHTILWRVIGYELWFRYLVRSF